MKGKEEFIFKHFVAEGPHEALEELFKACVKGAEEEAGGPVEIVAVVPYLWRKWPKPEEGWSPNKDENVVMMVFRRKEENHV